MAPAARAVISVGGERDRGGRSLEARDQGKDISCLFTDYTLNFSGVGLSVPIDSASLPPRHPVNHVTRNFPRNSCSVQLPQ